MSRDAGDAAGQERRGLLLSVWGALFMSALGFGFAFLTGSQAVLLDGVFSLIGCAVSLLSLHVASLILRPGDERFHFGYAAYEPLLNLSKGLLIGVVNLFALAAAVDDLLGGGRAIEGILAAVYAVVAAAGCLLISRLQRRTALRTESPLLQVDSRNWLIDAMLSGAVAVAFGVVVYLKGTAMDWIVPYADPLVVVLLVALSLPIPLRIIRDNWNQIAGRAPAPALQEEARSRLMEALEGERGMTPHLRMLETGRMLYLQVYLVLEEDSTVRAVEEMDALRERICRSVLRDTSHVGIDVIFTRDGKWVEHTISPASRRGDG